MRMLVWRAGENERAIAGLSELLADVQSVFGADHWLAAQTRAALAHALFSAGRLAEARRQAVPAAARLRALYGKDHRRARSAQQLVETIDANSGGR